jgi:hypothetical protein
VLEVKKNKAHDFVERHLASSNGRLNLPQRSDKQTCDLASVRTINQRACLASIRRLDSKSELSLL